MKAHTKRIAALCTLHSALCLSLWGQTTAFTYQGQLTDEGSPTTGIYDLRFAIYDSQTDGVSVGVLTNAATQVSDGLFTVALDFGPGVFDGSDRWLEIGVVTNGGGGFSTLSPRQQITSAPYAVHALNVSSDALLGEYGGAVSFSNPSNSFVGDGSGLTGVTLDGLAASNVWQLGGNGGVSAGVDFLGTIDTQPLELRVNGFPALRLEWPTLGSVPNVIGGHGDNTVSGVTEGAVIAGGGAFELGNTIGDSSNGSAIGGGVANHIRDYAGSATISGGGDNLIGNNAAYSTIGGGNLNSLTNVFYATIAGGEENQIGFNATDSSIGGGFGNTIGINSTAGTISGGEGNAIGSASPYSTIGGGVLNQVSGSLFSTVAGGQENSIEPLAYYSTIAGGTGNTVSSNATAATIGGGAGHSIGVDGDYSGIGAGKENVIGNNSQSATISGGSGNQIGTDSDYSTVSGGISNLVSGGAQHNTIGGGRENRIEAGAKYSTIPGGVDNAVSNDVYYAFAAGRRAKANHTGSFVWADSQNADFTSTASDQFAVRADRGVMIKSSSTALDLRGGGRVRVAGAGMGTATPAFIHRAVAGNISGNTTTIDHPHCNNDPNALLFVTQNWNPGGTGGVYNNHPIGVYYTNGKWRIFNQDSAAMPVDAAFNVLVVKP